MQGITAFLERFKQFTSPSRALCRAVQSAIKETLNAELPEHDLRANRGVVEITTSGTLKSEILLRKQEIMTTARAKAGDGLRDIR